MNPEFDLEQKKTRISSKMLFLLAIFVLTAVSVGLFYNKGITEEKLKTANEKARAYAAEKNVAILSATICKKDTVKIYNKVYITKYIKQNEKQKSNPINHGRNPNVDNLQPSPKPAVKPNKFQSILDGN